jgi:hypothetical protein
MRALAIAAIVGLVFLAAYVATLVAAARSTADEYEAGGGNKRFWFGVKQRRKKPLATVPPNGLGLSDRSAVNEGDPDGAVRKEATTDSP